MNMSYDLEKYNIISVERQIILNMDLIELVKGYCDNKSEKSDEASVISSILDIVIKNQHNILKLIDKTFI